jgi:transposase
LKGIIDMAYIIKEKRNNHIYYYIAESSRVNGKPRIVSKKYLGTAETISDILSRDETIPKPEYSKIFEFGAVLALYDIAERLNIRQIIDRHVVKRDQGLSVSDSILLAAINRAVKPTSKKSFFEWFEKTVLYTCFPKANKNNLSSQGFWNNMSLIDQKTIELIEDDITKVVVDKYNISIDLLLFDNTNFITYIDTYNKATLAKRGHSKEKRSDLKIVGLSLMVSPDHSIPLFHETYPGNTNDSKRFAEVIPKLKQRYKKLNKGDCEVTLVFDRGNNSGDNIEDILSDVPALFHFVGGLKLNQCNELISIPLKDFTLLKGDAFIGTRVYRTIKNVYGRDFTIVMTFNVELYIAQLRSVKNNREKCELQLHELSISLLKWINGEVKKGRKPSQEGVNKKIRSILSADYMSDLFIYELQMVNDFVKFTFNFSDDNYKKLKREILGRSFLFTDQFEWTNEQIVGAYRSQHHVENAFKQMKDTDYLTFRPMYHFTDSKIRVHAFYCVLSYLLVSLLNRELEDMDYKMSIDKMSIDKMLDCFQDVRQVITVFPKSKDHINNYVTSYSDLKGIAKLYIEKNNLMQYLNRGTTFFEL